jgi:hypothetical protein
MWLTSFTDLPGGVARLRRNLSGLDFFPAFLTFLVFAALIVPFAQALWLFDLTPTWDWISVLRMPPELEGDAALTWNTALASLGVSAAVAFWLLMLAPTFIECAFPRASRGIPAMALGLKLCIAFDYITDFPGMWSFISSIVWFTQFSAPVAWLLRGAVTVVLTFFVSLGLQVVVGLLLMGMLFLFLAMARQSPGTRNTYEHAPISEGPR